MNGANGSSSKHLTDALPLRKPKGRELLGGDLLAQSLDALGVKVAFGLHGGHLDAFLMGCEEVGIKLVDTRHETVAVQAAEGYAKVSGNVGVAFITANSGFSNGLPGLASALADRSPIFVITSSPPLRDAETNSLQGFHQQDIVAAPLTKFAHRITNAEEIPRIVAHGFRIAVASPPGPVLLDFPIDVLFTPPLEKMIGWGAIARPLPYPPGPDPETIRIVLELLRAAERPCIISGTGARSPEGRKALQSFVEATGVPLFHSTKYSSSLPLDHPLRGGPAGSLALLPSQNKQPPDLVILLGVRTGFLLGGRSGAIVPNKDCKLVQIDVDGAEIGRSSPIDLGIVSDASLFVAALNTALTASTPIQVPTEWSRTAVALKHTRSPHEDEPTEVAPGSPHPYHAVKKVFQSLEPGAIVIMDGGEASCWEQDLVETNARASLYIIATGYLGFLGNGWGYSLGAAVAAPDRQVVNMQGDGSAGFHIAELDTYARHGLNVLTVIFNNYCWGMSSNGQELIFGGSTKARPATALSRGCAYEVVARGFGCASEKVDRYEDIESAVRKLSQSGQAACLNMIVSEKPIVGATTAMVGMSDDKDMIVVPYYDNLPETVLQVLKRVFGTECGYVLTENYLFTCSKFNNEEHMMNGVCQSKQMLVCQRTIDVKSLRSGNTNIHERQIVMIDASIRFRRS